MTFVQPLSTPPTQSEPALTRVARALWSADPSNPPFDGLIEGRFSWNLAHDQARAALTAIGEPSEGMTAVAVKTYQDEGDGWTDTHCLTTAFAAMIDHILNGGE